MATQHTNITTSLKIKVENGTTNTGTVLSTRCRRQGLG